MEIGYTLTANPLLYEICYHIEIRYVITTHMSSDEVKLLFFKVTQFLCRYHHVGS